MTAQRDALIRIVTLGRHAQRDRVGLSAAKLARTTPALRPGAGHRRAFEERKDMPPSGACGVTLSLAEAGIAATFVERRCRNAQEGYSSRWLRDAQAGAEPKVRHGASR